MPIDYANGKVYCIRNSKDNDKIVYIGSTAQPLSARMAQHRRAIKQSPNTKIYSLMATVGAEHFKIELLTDFPCQRRDQLLAEEGRHIRLNQTTMEGNTHHAGRAKKEQDAEYYKANSAKIKAYQKDYKLKPENTAKLAERAEKYRENNKAKNVAYQKEYYMRNKAALYAKNRAYAIAHKAEVTAYHKNYNTVNKVVIAAQRKAKRDAQPNEPNT